MGSRLVAVALVVRGVMAWAAPGTPSPTSPPNGGWCARDCRLEWTYAPVLQTVGTDVQVFDESNVLVESHFTALTAPPDDAWTTPNLPDGGFFTWQVRGRDDAGVASAWSAPALFRLDGDGPSTPASLTLQLDGGWLRLTSAPMTDALSGFTQYHFVLSPIDLPDISFSGNVYDARQTTASKDVWLGPGTYFVAVHGHDAVGNVGTELVAGPVTAPESAVLPRPAPPALERTDGGPWPRLPWISSTAPFVVADAGAVPVTQWTFSQRVANSDAGWHLAGAGGDPRRNRADLFVGPLEFRVALVSGTEVSPWSEPIRFHVDTTAPLALTLTASVDGGLVTLSWPYGRDASAGSSGVEHYEVRRLRGAASVELPDVPHRVATLTTTDEPGFGAWSYRVASVDNAGNQGPADVVAVALPPPAPTGLAAVTPTAAPVEVRWDDPRDGGFDLAWTVTRLDASNVGVALGTTSDGGWRDDAPEGTWSYEVFAAVDGVRGPSARLDGVVRDVTPPVVDVPSLAPLGARSVLVSWTATDALAGLAATTVERASDAGVVSLGPRTSPFVDVPGTEGGFQYRVVAGDLAGNVSTSGWSADFSSAEGVRIDPVPTGTFACGQPVEQAFVAGEPVTWTLLEGPEGGVLGEDGVFRWTAQGQGASTVRVSASGAEGATAEQAWDLEVTCEPRRATVGCGCSGVEGALAVLALGALLRRGRGERRA